MTSFYADSVLSLDLICQNESFETLYLSFVGDGNGKKKDLNVYEDIKALTDVHLQTITKFHAGSHQ